VLDDRAEKVLIVLHAARDDLGRWPTAAEWGAGDRFCPRRCPATLPKHRMIAALAQLFRGPPADEQLTLYTGGPGIVCYEAWLPARTGSSVDLVGRLLNSDVRWHWTSRVRKSADLSDPGRRPWAALTLDTGPLLVDDFAERDEDGYGKYLALVGSGPTSDDEPRARASVERALTSFVSAGAPPVQAVILQLGDSADLVFVPAAPSEIADATLMAVQIRRDEVGWRRPYRTLYLARLERQLAHILEVAFD
jgi:hypothetical protein